MPRLSTTPRKAAILTINGKLIRIKKMAMSSFANFETSPT